MSDNENLKIETLEVLSQQGKSVKDIRWIGSMDGNWRIPVDYFFDVLADKEYDAGFGSAEVNQALVIVGDDWWLERHEYDGSENWVFNTLPILADDAKLCKSVFIEDYEDKWKPMSNLEYLEYLDSKKNQTH